MEKRWVRSPIGDRDVSARLQEELGVHTVIAELLARRGVRTFEEARSFFRPELSQLHDPFLMKGMDAAISRIEQAIVQKEKILVYGDYDVDGTTAVALFYGFFRQFHTGIAYYLPDRYAEGYGLSYQGIDYAYENGYSLIVTLDCGIKAIEQVAYANERQLDVIIGDHHLPGDVLPPAYAVLDPKREDCTYPFKELSGCGIGFKIIQAFAQKNQMDVDISAYLDLVAVSIASDIVPITGENRILAHFGLKKLNSNPCCGLQALIELSGNRNGHFTVNDILFQLGPRINAAGRIDHAKDAVRLLLADSLQKANHYSEGIDQQNTVRKDVDFRITEEALAMIEADEQHRTRKTTVLFGPDWHKGVIGIVASRLIEKYYRPTVILTQNDNSVTGSARSIEGFDLYEALSACADLLEQFGGHKYAAGLTMKPENVRQFQERFEAVVSARLTEDMLTRELLLDAELPLSEITARFYRILNQFEPFGPQNDRPLFVSRGVRTVGRALIVGANHLKFRVQADDTPIFDCIGFGLGHYADLIQSQQNFDICFTLEENVWREKRNLQLNIKGINLCEPYDSVLTEDADYAERQEL